MTIDIDWPFVESRNSAVFTSKRIVFNGDWIYYVTHDVEDGAWQFHPFSGITPEIEATVVSLEEMVRLDESLRLLSDLPAGWHAWRKSADAAWERSPIE
jgi:hypothetical protein